MRPLYHVAVLTGEFLTALINGTNIIFSDIPFYPVSLLRAVRKHQITVFCATPTIFYYLCRIMNKGEKLPLKKIVVSGECMTEHVAEYLLDFFPYVDVYHVYGLTEASPRISALLPELFSDIPLSVGLPLPSVQILIENNELLVKGKNVMKGYYHNLEATKRTLENGWLHTGDLAETDVNGRITIKGRKDDMIIRAGMNIYPQEIENKLREINEIEDVLAFGVPDNRIGEKIHLKVVSKNLSKTQIFACCRKLLSSYQLPDVIDIVEEIPKNASGKIIRKGFVLRKEDI